MMNQELKPITCPFCGEYPNIISGYSSQGTHIGCRNDKCSVNPSFFCAALVGEFSSLKVEQSKNTAIERWNTRAVISTISEETINEILNFARMDRALDMHDRDGCIRILEQFGYGRYGSTRPNQFVCEYRNMLLAKYDRA